MVLLDLFDIEAENIGFEDLQVNLSLELVQVVVVEKERQLFEVADCRFEFLQGEVGQVCPPLYYQLGRDVLRNQIFVIIADELRYLGELGIDISLVFEFNGSSNMLKHASDLWDDLACNLEGRRDSIGSINLEVTVGQLTLDEQGAEAFLNAVVVLKQGFIST